MIHILSNLEKNMNDSMLGICLIQEQFIHNKNKHKMSVVIGWFCNALNDHGWTGMAIIALYT